MIVIITTIIATSPMTLSHHDYQYQHEMQNLASFHHTMARGVLSFEFLVCRGCHRGCRPAGTHKARTRSNLVINVGLKSSAEKPPLTTRVISGTCVIMASAVGDMHNSINRTHATREVKVLTLLGTAVRMPLLGAGTARHGRKETTTTKSLPETTRAIALPRHSNACKHPPSQCHPQQFSKANNSSGSSTGIVVVVAVAGHRHRHDQDDAHDYDYDTTTEQNEAYKEMLLNMPWKIKANIKLRAASRSCTATKAQGDRLGSLLAIVRWTTSACTCTYVYVSRPCVIWVCV